MNIYFDDIEIVTDKFKFEPHQIFNCDESGIMTVHRPVKIVKKKENIVFPQ